MQNLIESVPPRGGEADLPERPGAHGFGWRVFEVSSIAVAVLIIASVLWLAIDVLLLLFAAVLLATLLRAPAEALHRGTGMPCAPALALVTLGLAGLLGLLGMALVPQVAPQVPELIESLGSAVTDLARRFNLDQLAADAANDGDIARLLPSPAGLIGGATGLISSTFGMVANLVIVVVIGLYLAANPAVYVRGVLRLVPQSRRMRVGETLDAVGETLRWWLIGQLAAMTAVGLLTYLGLKLIGVPLALVLAAIAFVLSFIPFLGAILAAVPVLLVAASEGLEMGLYALIVYGLIQSLEGYVITPLVQRRSVALPPAVTIAAQVLFGVLVGMLGVALATPLAAAAMVAIRMLYLEDVLGEPADR